MSTAVRTPPSALSAQKREHLRNRSKQLFGNMDRLDVAISVGLSEDGLVNATDLSWDLRIANNRVRAQLLALVDLGVVQKLPRQSGGKQFYQRLESSFWETCSEFYDRFVAEQVDTKR